MPDKYDDAIDLLVVNPHTTRRMWSASRGRVSSPLFQFCTPDGMALDPDRGIRECGCLTEIRDGHKVACKKSLTLEIRRDVRIHTDIDYLQDDLIGTNDPEERRKLLAPYAEWQRRLDAEIRQPQESRQ